MTLLSEIAQQGAVVKRLIARLEPALQRVGELVEGCSHVVIAARGTSDNAARYAQYLWGAHNGLVVGLTTPSLFGPLESPPDLSGALVVGISQSGESPDLIAVLAEATRQQRPTLVVTNEPDSPLATRAGLVVDLGAGTEAAVAATKTYTASLAAVALVSRAWGASEIDLGALPGALDESVTPVAAGPVAAMVEASRCAVVARGYHLATAHEWALKIQELTYMVAQPYSAADFLHGPVAAVEPGFPVLAVVAAGPTEREMTELAEELMRRGAKVITLTDLPDAPGDFRIPFPRTDPWLSPIVASPKLQLFAHALALAKGLDPDAPRGLSKVTRTR